MAPLAGLTARSLPGKVPPAIRRPPTTASSVTLPEARLALKALSTAPVVGLSLATPRRATPLTEVKVPPIHNEVPSLAIAQTSPFTLGAKLVLTTPVLALKATMLLRAKVPPELTPAGVLTELNAPPAYMVAPTWVNLYTAPLATFGVKLAGLALTTVPSAIDAEATVGTAATAMLRPSATSTVRSVRLLNGTNLAAPSLQGGVPPASFPGTMGWRRRSYPLRARGGSCG